MSDNVLCVKPERTDNLVQAAWKKVLFTLLSQSTNLSVSEPRFIVHL